MKSRKKITETEKTNSFIIPTDGESPIILPLEDVNATNTLITFHTEKSSVVNGVSKQSSTSTILQIVKEPTATSAEATPSKVKTRAQNGITVPSKKRRYDDIIDLEAQNKPKEKKRPGKKARTLDNAIIKIEKELAQVNEELESLTEIKPENRDDTFDVFDQVFTQCPTPPALQNRSPLSSGNLSGEFSLGYGTPRSLSYGSPRSPQVNIYNYSGGVVNMYTVNKLSTPPEFLDPDGQKEAEATFNYNIGLNDDLENPEEFGYIFNTF